MVIYIRGDGSVVEFFNILYIIISNDEKIKDNIIKILYKKSNEIGLTEQIKVSVGRYLLFST